MGIELVLPAIIPAYCHTYLKDITLQKASIGYMPSLIFLPTAIHTYALLLSFLTILVTLHLFVIMYGCS